MEPDFYVPVIILVIGTIMGLLFSWETFFAKKKKKTKPDSRGISKEIEVMRPKRVGYAAIGISLILVIFGIWQVILSNDQDNRTESKIDKVRAEAMVEADKVRQETERQQEETAKKHQEVLTGFKTSNDILKGELGQLEPKFAEASREAKHLREENQKMQAKLDGIQVAVNDKSKSDDEFKATVLAILGKTPPTGTSMGKFPPEVVGHLLFPASVKPLFRSLNAPDPGPYPQWLFIPRSENSAYRLVPGAENYWVDLGVKGQHHVMELRALPGKTVANRSIVVELATARPNGQIAYSPATLGFDGQPKGSVYEFPDEGKAVEVHE